MGLQREFEAQGQWLFRWRGILPFLFTPMIALAVADTRPSAQWSNLATRLGCHPNAIAVNKFRCKTLGLTMAWPGLSGRFSGRIGTEHPSPRIDSGSSAPWSRSPLDVTSSMEIQKRACTNVCAMPYCTAFPRKSINLGEQHVEGCRILIFILNNPAA